MGPNRLLQDRLPAPACPLPSPLFYSPEPRYVFFASSEYRLTPTDVNDLWLWRKRRFAVAPWRFTAIVPDREQPSRLTVLIKAP
jgi:hypothetical protein